MPFENIVGKGENAGYQHFLLFPQYFLPLPIQGLSSILGKNIGQAGGSEQQPPVFKSCTLPAALCGLAHLLPRYFCAFKVCVARSAQENI